MFYLLTILTLSPCDPVPKHPNLPPVTTIGRLEYEDFSLRITNYTEIYCDDIRIRPQDITSDMKAKHVDLDETKRYVVKLYFTTTPRAPQEK